MISVVLNEDGYVDGFVEGGQAVDGIDFEEKPEGFDERYFKYRIVEGELVYDPGYHAQIEAEEIRSKRRTECFPYINRGYLWADKLTSDQKEELSIWYQAWLDAPSTLIIPERPLWLR